MPTLRRAVTIVATALATLVLTAAIASAAASAAEITIGADGKSEPNFAYADAVRERLFITQTGVDQDLDDADDVISFDVIRPVESGP